MNTTTVAAAMMAKAATRTNADFSAMVGSAFFLKSSPLLAPQKDGNFTLVRVHRGEDEKVIDLDAAAAETLLIDWLGAVDLKMPNDKERARYAAKLAELGWAE